jgi:hypothetical protein
MTRITMPASAFHQLLAPVLPHTATGLDNAPFHNVQIDVREGRVYFAGTDKRSLAVTRHPAEFVSDPTAGQITISRVDALGLLNMFVTNKLSDPQLTLTLDEDELRVAADEGADVGVPAAPYEPKFPNWRDALGRLFHRPQLPAASAVLLQPDLMARFAKVGKTHRLRFLAGPAAIDPILVLADDGHFAGVWRPVDSLDAARDDQLEDLPWREEFTDAHGQEVFDLSTWGQPAAGEEQGELGEDADQ